MRISENRTLAFVVLAVCVVFSLSFSSGRALKNLRTETEHLFYQGVDGSGLSIDRDLSVQAECTYNLASTASSYAVTGALIDNAKAAADQLEAATGIAEKFRASQAAQRAVEDLYTALSNTAMSTADQSFALKNYKEFQSRADTIRRSATEYNTPAEAFNRERSGFLARLLAGLNGIEPLELYQ